MIEFQSNYHYSSYMTFAENVLQLYKHVIILYAVLRYGMPCLCAYIVYIHAVINQLMYTLSFQPGTTGPTMGSLSSSICNI